ncbi:MAG TPA: DUF885 domain-containing protein, partial [Gammaproteobacteria bacterium]|nr:DUF885 domain-containing protein [Gammaproteobacteria bacterium]
MMRRINTLAIVAAFVFASAICAQPPQSQALAESQRLNDWFDARFEERLDFSPMFKTRLGRKDDYDRIDDMSEAAGDAQFQWSARSVEDLQNSFDYDLLTPEAKTSYDLWIYQHEQAAASRPFRRRDYVFHQMGGMHTGLPRFLITNHRVDDESDMLAWVARIEGAATAIGQLLERARLASQEGVHAPRFAYESVIEQSGALIAGVPFDADSDVPSPLWSDAVGKIDSLVAAAAIDEAGAAELRDRARAALLDHFAPAWRALIGWAESELPKTGELATGVWNLPDGPALYEQRLAAMTTTDMTAEEIHALGLSEVARIHGEMEALKDSVEFDGTLQEFFTFVREDPQFIYPTNDAGRNAYLDAARGHLNRMEQRLPEFFALLPKAELEVRRVEAFRERPGQAQHYQRGTPDGSRPGIFYAHLIDMSSMPIPELESIAYHEGLPGHHMQLAIAQELTGLPTFRTLVGFTAYSEGWGLYAEWLAREMGGYEDPFSDFGRLSSEIWRAIRLVVDTG